MEKRCSRCKEVKDVSLFPKNKYMKDGLSHWCKLCKSLHNKFIQFKKLKRLNIQHNKNISGYTKPKAEVDHSLKPMNKNDIHFLSDTSRERIRIKAEQERHDGDIQCVICDKYEKKEMVKDHFGLCQYCYKKRKEFLEKIKK